MLPQQAPADSDIRYTASRIEVRGKGDGPTIESVSAANAQCHALG
ncbi:MAG: hypothetical protein SF172_17680 [Burkholderiales bacterium]|nr:hypothetical protein [Burkholderiales bacterium]